MLNRMVSVYLPWWSVERVRRGLRREGSAAPPNPPLLLVTVAAGTQRVARRCPQSAQAGVQEGMALAQARSLLPAEAVLVLPFWAEEDAGALGRLAQWATRFSPLVRPDPPDGLLLDITGCERVFRGEPRLRLLLGRALGRLGLTPWIGVASTAGAAWALARYASEPDRVVHEQEPGARLDALPVQALRIEPPIVDKLRLVGIERIGQLRAMGRAELADRFGRSVLCRMDQAMGRMPETVHALPAVAPMSFEREFDGPCTQPEAIDITVRGLIDEVARALSKIESGACRVDVALFRVRAEAIRLNVVFGKPSRDAKHLWTVLRPKLEQANLGWGVERVTLTVARHGLLPHQQQDLSSDLRGPSNQDRDDDLLHALLDQWVNRIGADRVLSPAPVASHRPEQKRLLRPAAGGSEPGGGGLLPGIPRPADADPRSQPRGLSSDLPSVLFDRPEPIRVARAPNQSPTKVQWRNQEHRIVAALGPCRIGPEWWRCHIASSAVGPDMTRDYFKLQDHAGRWLWIYQEVESSRWFIHGRFS